RVRTRVAERRRLGADRRARAARVVEQRELPRPRRRPEPGGLREVRDQDLLPRGGGRRLLVDDALLPRIVTLRGDPLVVVIAAVGRDRLVRAGDLRSRARGREATRGGLAGAVDRLDVCEDGRAAGAGGRGAGGAG